MKPQDFNRDFRSVEKLEETKEILLVTENRQANAEAALRIGRFVKGYDRVGYWPHLHAPHDELVGPLYGAKGAAIAVGSVFALLVTEQYISDPTLTVKVIALGAFLGLSQVAESAFCAWKPIPQRFDRGARAVLVCALGAAVPVFAWLLMRVPGTPLASLAETWEGVALVASELSLLFLGAAAGAALRAYRWSRDFVRRDLALRDRLIELGAETAVPTDEAEPVLE